MYGSLKTKIVDFIYKNVNIIGNVRDILMGLANIEAVIFISSRGIFFQ